MTDSNPIARFRKNRQEAGKEFREKLKKSEEIIKKTKTSKVIRGAITGPIKAINETIEFVDDIKDYVKGNPYDNNDFFPLQNTPLESEDDQDDPFYKIPQAITQFLLPMGLISKGLSKAGMANVWARNALSGFVADTVVQDPLEENLFNMLDNHPRLESPITEILKTDEDATVIENRLRQAGGGFLAGEVVTALGLGIRGLRKSPELVDRIVKRLDERKKIKVNDFTTDNLGDEIIDIVSKKKPVTRKTKVSKDPKIQTTFNPKFTGTSEEVRTSLLDLAEELKKKDANNTWPYRRTFADMAAAADAAAADIASGALVVADWSQE